MDLSNVRPQSNSTPNVVTKELLSTKNIEENADAAVKLTQDSPDTIKLSQDSPDLEPKDDGWIFCAMKPSQFEKACEIIDIEYHFTYKQNTILNIEEAMKMFQRRLKAQRLSMGSSICSLSSGQMADQSSGITSSQSGGSTSTSSKRDR